MHRSTRSRDRVSTSGAPSTLLARADTFTSGALDVRVIGEKLDQLEAIVSRVLQFAASGFDAAIMEVFATSDGRADPYSRYRQVRDVAPVHHCLAPDVWYLTDYRHSKDVLHDPRFHDDPVRYDELGTLDIDVSVLSPLAPAPGPRAAAPRAGARRKRGPEPDWRARSHFP